MRHVHNSLHMVILSYKADMMVHVTKDWREREKNEREKIPQNLAMALALNNFWQIYNWLWNTLLKNSSLQNK